MKKLHLFCAVMGTITFTLSLACAATGVEPSWFEALISLFFLAAYCWLDYLSCTKE